MLAAAMVISVFTFSALRFARTLRGTASATTMTFDDDVRDRIPKRRGVAVMKPKINEIEALRRVSIDLETAKSLAKSGNLEQMDLLLHDAESVAQSYSQDTSFAAKGEYFKTIADQIGNLESELRRDGTVEEGKRLEELLGKIRTRVGEKPTDTNEGRF